MSNSSFNVKNDTFMEDSDLFEDPFDNEEDLQKYKNKINSKINPDYHMKSFQKNDTVIIIDPISDESIKTKNLINVEDRKRSMKQFLKRKTTTINGNENKMRNKNINIEEFCNQDLNMSEFKGFSNLKKSSYKKVDTKNTIFPEKNFLKKSIIRNFTLESNEKDSKEIKEIKESNIFPNFKNNNSDLTDENYNHKNEKLGIEIIEELPNSELKNKIKAYKRKKTILRNLKELSRIKLLIPKRFKLYNKNLTKQISLTSKFYGKTIGMITGRGKNILNNLLIIKISKCGRNIALSIYKNVLIILKIKPDPPSKLIDPSNFLVLINEKSNQTENQITHIEWSSKSKYVATAMLDHKLYVWDIKKKSIIMEVSHDEMITAIAFFGEQKVVVSALKNGHLRFWDIDKGTTLFWHHLEAYITAIRFSPNAEYLISGYMDGSIKIHKYFEKFTAIFSCNISKLNYVSSKKKNLEKPKERKKGFIGIFMSKKLRNNKIYDFIFVSEKKFLILSQGCRIRLFNIETQLVEQKYKINNGFSQIPQSIDYFNGYVLMSCYNGKIYFWDEKNNYVPPFNPKFFYHNNLINFCFEEFTAIDNFQKTPKNFFACFLNKDLLDEWNLKTKKREAEYIFMNFTNTGSISFCIKEKTVM